MTYGALKAARALLLGSIQTCLGNKQGSQPAASQAELVLYMETLLTLFVRKIRFTVLTIFFVAALVGAGQSVNAAPVTIKAGYPQPSGAQLPVWVIAEAGTDRKYGVELQVIYISGGARLTQTVVAGDIDMAMTGGAVVNGILSGAELVYVAIGVPTYGFSVYARRDDQRSLV
jgi:ABC-type nitrate/sulfonate/bicarbonate transport system substrate-binding protein